MTCDRRQHTGPICPGLDVRTSHDRGARRIVSGQGGEIYYTGDHYKSFRAVLR